MLNGRKRWIGNATFADIIVIWARSSETKQASFLCTSHELAPIIPRTLFCLLEALSRVSNHHHFAHMEAAGRAWQCQSGPLKMPTPRAAHHEHHDSSA